MKPLKTFAVTGYLSIFGWWLILNLHNIRDSLAAVYFCLGLSLYFIILGIWLVFRLVGRSKIFKLKYAGIFTGLGIVSLGLSYLNIFHIEINVRWFSQMVYSELFYFFQFPLSLTGLLLISERRGVFRKSFLVFLSIVLIAILLSKFNIHMFFIIYFFVKSIFLVFLSLLVIVEREQHSSLYLIFLGYLFWFFGDLATQIQKFIIQTQSGSFTDILYLSAIFLVFFGVISYINRYILDILDDNNNLISFRNIPYQIPFSLNIWLNDLT